MLERLSPYLRNNEAALGFGVIFIVVLLVVPLPGPILDGLILLSLFSGLIIILTSLNSTTPAEFTVFPTLLLVTTVYRLAVNVSTTRMILTQGANSNSALIEAFGTFVVGGTGSATLSLVVGIIIFIILTLVQVMVITKGATRISEVSARFVLDSLPGKQLAIDSDLAAGYINEKEARRRRENLQKEMNFYGAMDGASKFVQGDVRLGLIITAINIIGGIIVGMSIRGEPFATALETYTKFTIGDGLVSAIPALLITSATGVIVTRSVSEEALPEEMKTQLFANPKLLYIVGSMFVAGALLPGFPFLAMVGIGGLLIWLGIVIEKSIKEKAIAEEKRESDKKDEKLPETYIEHLKTDPLEVEIGYYLISLVDPKQGGTMLDQISRLRRRFATGMGLIVPPVRIRDNMNLEPGAYVIKLQGNPVARFKLEPDRLMAIDTGKVTVPLTDGTQFTEPTYGLKAIWITPEQKMDAESAGYDVVDPATVIATHLSSVIEENSSEIMGRQEVKKILDSIREENAVVVDEVLQERKLGVGQVQAVLASLLREHVSIRNMTRILETIASNAVRTAGDPYLLTEAVRQALRRQIAGEYADESGVISAITIEPGIDRRLREGIHRDPEEGFVMALKPDFQVALRDALIGEYQQVVKNGGHPVFISSREIRAGLFSIIQRHFPARSFAVLAHEEIPPDIRLNIVGQVALRRQEEPVEAE
ncbi:MAG: FHIPEP family type III secretion protein [Spirochaetales bacterium]|nr:FHIPEP family type III secretion protein [Spirochaetales bacterium]